MNAASTVRPADVLGRARLGRHLGARARLREGHLAAQAVGGRHSERNASVQLSTDHPHDGQQCLKLHYHFTGGGQYMGLTHPVKIHSPIHKLRFMLYGDGSGTGTGCT